MVWWKTCWSWFLLFSPTPTSATGNRNGATNPYAWTPERKVQMREEVRELWYHGYDNYMAYAFPMDELQPVSCQGRGPDWDDPTNIGVNDVNGNFSITLIDVLDTLITIDDLPGFSTAVRNVIERVSFDVDTKPQVFETTIRALGGLLSGHIVASGDWDGGRGRLDWYQGELLDLAKDLGERLLPAFWTPTGMPYARVNLRKGVPKGETTQTCTAGAGSLLLEFTMLSRLTGDPKFEEAGKKSFMAVWDRRTSLGLVGNGIDVVTGSWYYPIGGGIGAGIDSFYEYALKMYVLTGEDTYLDIWNEAYAAIMKHSKASDGHWYRSVNAFSGEVSVNHIDSLGAFWPGLQVLAGDIESAIKGHLAYWNLWKRFGGLPETFNIVSKEGITMGYPLRPEFIESTYFLYRATKDPFYLSVGERVLDDLKTKAKVPCGLSTISNLLTGEREDRMESFLLSETLKYLYLLFDEDNRINKMESNYVFTTEAHIFTLSGSQQLRSELPKPPTLTSGGLFGSVEDRGDVDYAQHLVGLELLDGDLSAKHRPDGRCDAPRTDEYYTSFILTPHGELQSDEDISPSEDKVAKVEDGAFMVYNITGLRLKAATRIGEQGYDIIRIGTHDVEKTDTVYFADPKLLKEKEESASVPIASGNHAQDVPLRFFFRQTVVQQAADPDAGLPEELEVITVGSAAIYGDHPGKDVSDASKWRRRRFGRGQRPMPLVRPPPDNLHGCTPYPQLPYSLDLDADADPEVTYNPRYLGTVLLLKRGECTFFEKINNAQLAGASAVIITSDELVVPSLGEEDSDKSIADLYLTQIGMVVIAGNENIEKLGTLLDVGQEVSTLGSMMVEVTSRPSPVETNKPPKPATPPQPKSKTHWNALRKSGYGRPLYINGKKIHNAILLF